MPDIKHLFEDVCISGDREGPPKFHVVKYHWVDFIEMYGISWAAAEEAGEAAHAVVSDAANSNARQKGRKKKLLGTLATLQRQNSLKFQIANQKMSIEGIRRHSKNRNNC